MPRRFMDGDMKWQETFTEGLSKLDKANRKNDDTMSIRWNTQKSFFAQRMFAKTEEEGEVNSNKTFMLQRKFPIRDVTFRMAFHTFSWMKNLQRNFIFSTRNIRRKISQKKCSRYCKCVHVHHDLRWNIQLFLSLLIKTCCITRSIHISERPKAARVTAFDIECQSFMDVQGVLVFRVETFAALTFIVTLFRIPRTGTATSEAD